MDDQQDRQEKDESHEEESQNEEESALEYGDAQQSDADADADADADLDSHSHSHADADEIRSLQEEVANLKDQCLRAYADTENLRKRNEREMQDARKFAVSGIVEDLVNVVEALYRSTEHISEEDHSNERIVKIVEGIELTRKELMSVLSKNNVTRVEPKLGDIFDHNFHEALSQVADDNYPKNAITQVIQAGYLIGDRLIKPALVIVSSGS